MSSALRLDIRLFLLKILSTGVAYLENFWGPSTKPWGDTICKGKNRAMMHHVFERTELYHPCMM